MAGVRARRPDAARSDHADQRDDKTHPADRGAWHSSPIVDTWTGEHQDALDAIEVRVEGYRHDEPDHPDGGGGDWPDQIVVEGSVHPGTLSSVALPLADARRLGHALLLACDLLEGK